MNPDLAAHLRKIRLLLLDVDGVMTGGQIILSGDDEFKAFHVQDGLGIHLLENQGVRVGIITGRESAVVKRRARELGVSILFQGVTDKINAFRVILNNENITAEETCFVGDDLLDLPLIIRCGVGVSVPNGRSEVKERADWVTETPGGQGAVREVAEAILKAQGKWETIVSKFTS